MPSATATVKGGLWAKFGTTMVGMNSLGAGKRAVARTLGFHQNRRFRELIDALNGIAPGGGALQRAYRIQASTELGGVRPVEFQDLINRITTAADVTEVATVLNFTGLTSDPTPVPNLDGSPLGSKR